MLSDFKMASAGQVSSAGQVLTWSFYANKVLVSVDGSIPEIVDSTKGFRVPTSFDLISSVSGHSFMNTAAVVFLDKPQLLPQGFIDKRIPQGPKEYFATVASLRHVCDGPLTTALHFSMGKDGIATYALVIGGGKLTGKFPFKALFNTVPRESGDDDTEICFTVDPSSINWPENKCVTEWTDIRECFRDLHVSQGAIIDLRNVLVRWRLRSNLSQDGRSSPTLLLEAIAVPDSDGSWDAVPETKKFFLSDNGSAAIMLWHCDVHWYSPMPDNKLETAAGFSRISLEVPTPSEFIYRWLIQAVFSESDLGRSVESNEEFWAYWKSPCLYDQRLQIVYWLNYPFPDCSVPPATGYEKGRATSYHTFSRNGKVFTRSIQLHKANKYNILPKSNNPRSRFLPLDAPSRLESLASNLFNASVAKSTAKSFTTASNHISKLEIELGRKFDWPLSDQDLNLVIAYLIDKGIQPATVNNYLAGVKRLSYSHGVNNPSPVSSLGKLMLQGHKNLSRNPILAVKKNVHRPVTIPLLRLLAHVLATKWMGNNFERQAFWTICLVAFWGSFRMGELLCQTKAFSPGSDLLASDAIAISDSSLALWIRDPKVPKEFGDVVELWSIPQFVDLDPVAAFNRYWKERSKRNFPMNTPLFLKDNGFPFTHSSFGSIFKTMLNQLPSELDLEGNKWTCHSFRSGLPTLLQMAGFNDEEIKSWGRWSSSAFQLYTKDLSRRFAVQRSILNAMDSIKKVVDPHK